MIDGSGAPRKRGRKPGESIVLVKRAFLEQIKEGRTIEEALHVVDRGRKAYEQWRSTDRDFAIAVDRSRKAYINKPVKRIEMGFPEFSKKYLDATVFPHTQNVVDMIEGREPSWLHPSMVYEQGEKDLVIVNMPPEHAKTTSITINYCVYRICMDPNVRIILVSKTQTMARKMLYAIKSRLTHPKYSNMQMAYGPPGGFDNNSEAWNADRIYISDDVRDSGEKDPTVEALGIGSHVYGARADLVICDDTVDLSNAHNYDKQIDWLQGELLSRISSNGSMLIVGTRLSGRDLYLELREAKRYPDEVSPWSYLAMPAVLEADDDPANWVTLWPRSNQPEAGDREANADPDGLHPKWDGPRLQKKRARVAPRTWSLVYQQQQVSEDAIFNPDIVRGCVNGNRMTGLIPDGMVNCRPGGMSGLIVVAGLDPATTGYTAAVVAGLDPVTHKRYVLDVHNEAGMKSEAMRELIIGWTDKYRITEFRIEKNAFQGFLVHDRELNEELSRRGCIIRGHFTGSNKQDPDFGIAAMAMLMNGWELKNNLLELPSTAMKEASKELVSQLITWTPAMKRTGKGSHYDIVMALWIAMLACQDRDSFGSNKNFFGKNAFLSPRDLEKRKVVNIDQYLLEREAANG